MPRDGVSFIDPHHLPFNKLPPPVHIEQIIADGKTYDPTQGQRLPPLVRNLAINKFERLALASNSLAEPIDPRVSLASTGETSSETHPSTPLVR